MSDANATDEARRRSARRHLLLIGGIAAAPFIVSWLLYKFWQPARFMNHGELVANLQPPAPGETDPMRQALKDLAGKWVLATVDSGQCGDACRKKLYYLRQIRLTQGKEMDRVERLWMVSDQTAPDPALLKEHAGLRIVHVTDSQWVRHLPPGAPAENYLFILDPLGNVVLRYPPGFDPTGMKKDLSRLIRASRIG